MNIEDAGTTVEYGVIVGEDVDLPEAATVTVVLQLPGDDYAELTPAEAAELDAAIAEAERGEGVLWTTVRERLRDDGS